MFTLVTHNYYLDQWFGLGVIGLFCFVAILYQTVATARRAAELADRAMRPYMLALVFGMVGLSICIFFDNLDKPWCYVWVYVGFSLRAASEIIERARKRAAESTRQKIARPAYSPNAAALSARRRFVGEVRR
jgi:O-antigen ligase